MTWQTTLIAFLLAATMGMGLAALIASLRPEWSLWRRTLVAASFLPIVTVIATLAGILVVRGHDDQGMADLAIAALVRLGGLFALIALAGGIFGAVIVRRRAGRR